MSLLQSHFHEGLFSAQQGPKNQVENNKVKKNRIHNNDDNKDSSTMTVIAVEGQEVAVDCCCDSKPAVEAADIKWRLEGPPPLHTPPLDQANIAFKNQGRVVQGSRLFLAPIDHKQQGTYVCLCSNRLQPYNLSPFSAFARKQLSLSVLCELLNLSSASMNLIFSHSSPSSSSSLHRSPPILTHFVNLFLLLKTSKIETTLFYSQFP